MQSLRAHIEEAQEKDRGIGHFNAANSDMLWAIFEGAQVVSEEAGEKVPVIVGTSEGERAAIGARQAVVLVKSIRDQYEYPIFLNADHCHSLTAFKEAVDAGYDAAIIDQADKDLDENIAVSKEAVSYAREHNPGMLVEGEVGYIGTSSKMLDEIPEGASTEEMGLVTEEVAERYAKETGVDLFAPAVGNLHGMLKGASNPRLNIDRIKSLAEASGVSQVLHGGSGVSDDDFVSAIEAGMPVVHISTELRVAYREGLESELERNPEELAPYRYGRPAREAMAAQVAKRMQLFWKGND